MDSPNFEPSSVIQVDRATLQQLVVKLLQRKGMFVAEAEIVAERMIEADLLQRSDEGVGSLPEYLDAMDLGDIDPRARIMTITETPAVAVLDGSTGMGHLATTKAMLLAVEKAKVVGTGTVVIKNSRPCGDLGGIASLAANQGLIGMVTTSLDLGSDAIAGTHNLAWAISAPDGAAPLICRERTQSMNGGISLLCHVLSAGLAGADMQPHKRKANRAANSIEYSLVAISQETFGTRNAFFSKWKSLWPDAAARDQSVGTTVPIRPADAQRLTELAAKIKFALTW